MLLTDTPVFIDETHPMAIRYKKWWEKRCNTPIYLKRLYYEFLITLFCETSKDYGKVIAHDEKEADREPERINPHAYFLGGQVGAFFNAQVVMAIVKFIWWVMAMIWLGKMFGCIS